MNRNPLYTIPVYLGQLSDRFPEIQEINLDPIVIVDGKPVVVDPLLVR